MATAQPISGGCRGVKEKDQGLWNPSLHLLPAAGTRRHRGLGLQPRIRSPAADALVLRSLIRLPAMGKLGRQPRARARPPSRARDGSQLSRALSCQPRARAWPPATLLGRQPRVRAGPPAVGPTAYRCASGR
jgi:hypothetical protein